MKLPRDLSGAQLIKVLERLGYQPTRQSGSHARPACASAEEHPLTIPLHDSLRVGTLAAIPADIAAHHRLTRDALVARLFG